MEKHFKCFGSRYLGQIVIPMRHLHYVHVDGKQDVYVHFVLNTRHGPVKHIMRPDLFAERFKLYDEAEVERFNAERKAEKERIKALDVLEAMGIDPDDFEEINSD
jgi:hypothetical protein